jgi:CheY-like chemotaxis protein
MLKTSAIEIGPGAWRDMELSSTDLSSRLSASSSEENARSPGRVTVSPRILMAEDNIINQKVGKLILQRAGFDIDVVADGNEAVQAHRANPYDVILMDCQMPSVDGFEASRQIRSLEQRQPAIIAVTANALAGERERCLHAGMDDYLSKPFQAEQLIAVVKKWAAHTRG